MVEDIPNAFRNVNRISTRLEEAFSILPSADSRLALQAERLEDSIPYPRLTSFLVTMSLAQVPDNERQAYGPASTLSTLGIIMDREACHGTILSEEFVRMRETDGISRKLFLLLATIVDNNLPAYCVPS